MAVRNRVCGPTQCGITAMTPRCTKSGGKLDGGQRMPGAGLSCRRSRKAPLGKPTFQPYWGKPAVRNDRGDRGNVGIIRSPIRASILPEANDGREIESNGSGCIVTVNASRATVALTTFQDRSQAPRVASSRIRNRRPLVAHKIQRPSGIWPSLHRTCGPLAREAIHVGTMHLDVFPKPWLITGSQAFKDASEA